MRYGRITALADRIILPEAMRRMGAVTKPSRGYFLMCMRMRDHRAVLAALT